eukprot:CAMPEP_0172545370 /NCGR_PEP_ID=MMETSP1067-20121228/15302_1 /TAXON_ID=265564 ORGANISM="Thalassiosira punctigera, Strain Tpunct2005C2" /NCGR_SAMPLE_ID=MMETSP1067 /ASSEMBLY_ACC=CAM_ASM_000444 /LENGTH=390 /DNA_ID=CAMNT_0013332091 /DNA_START=38 /DNA_END=1210 /DNA_ORIENTATION=-
MLPPAKSRTLWTKEEDEIVTRALMEDPRATFTRWTDLASRLPGRKLSGRQIRDRWNNYLNPVLSQVPFTRDDDMQLWNGYKEFGNRWVEIGSKKFGSKRSENYLKNRWNSVGFKKFVAKEFGADAYENAKLVHAPGRECTEEIINRGVAVEAGSIFQPDNVYEEARRNGFVSYSPPTSVDSSLLFAKEFRVNLNEDTMQTQSHVHWQPKWVGRIGEIGSQEVFVVREAMASDTRKEEGKGSSLVAFEKEYARSTPSKKRKTSAHWTTEEEQIVLEAIMSEPNKAFSRWSGLALRLPGRTSKQIRDRWTNYLDPALNRQPFSLKDDMILWNAYKELGNRWVEIGIKKFGSKRSENQIKNRWYSVGFKKFIAKEFGVHAYENAKQVQKARDF